jgi:N-acetylglucosamine malate deacetylase 1
MKKLREIKQRVHSWAFELNLIRRVHNISRYWSSGEIRKEGFFSKPTKAAVLSPHPDDESIGCGGTIGLIKEAGGTVDVFYMTRGEQGRPSRLSQESPEAFMQRRMNEAKEACKILGVDNVDFFEGRDGELKRQGSLAKNIAQKLDQGQYDIVFCPWPYDSHSDHEATYTLFRSAMLLCVYPVKHVWLYEVWSPLHANRIVNIDSKIEQKCNALQAYISQVGNNDLPSKVRALAHYRSIHLPEASHAEAFMALDGPDLALLP